MHPDTEVCPENTKLTIFVIFGSPLQRTKTLKNMLETTHMMNTNMYRAHGTIARRIWAYTHSYTHLPTAHHAKYFRHHSEIKTGMAGIVRCTQHD
jgi:hypothetical protein